MPSFPATRRVAVACALATLCAFAPTPARADGRNLLGNPGFEDAIEAHEWMPAAWDTSKGNTEMVFFGRDDFSAHSGKYGVNLANASATIPLWHNWNQTVDVTPDMWDKDAVLTVWTRSNGVDGRGFVSVKAYRDSVGKMSRQWKLSRDDAARKLMLAGTNDPVTDLGWKRESFDQQETPWMQRTLRVYVAPSTDVLIVSLGLYGTGQVMFDDASLTLEAPTPAQLPAPHTNLLADPGFEGNTLPWEISAPPWPPIIVGRDTTRAHSGSASMHFNQEVGIVAGTAGVAQVINNRALSGQRLRLTAYAKAESLGSAIFVHLFCHTRTGFTHESSPQSVYGTMNWTKLVVEADVPPDTYDVWAWIQYTAPVPGHAYFDDGVLELLGPATGAPQPGLKPEAIATPPKPRRTGAR